VYSLEHLELDQHKTALEAKARRGGQLTPGQQYQRHLLDLCILNGYSDLKKILTLEQQEKLQRMTRLEKQLINFPRQLIQVLTFANFLPGRALH
jgi:hypothetical protein